MEHGGEVSQIFWYHFRSDVPLCFLLLLYWLSSSDWGQVGVCGGHGCLLKVINKEATYPRGLCLEVVYRLSYRALECRFSFCLSKNADFIICKPTRGRLLIIQTLSTLVFYFQVHSFSTKVSFLLWTQGWVTKSRLKRIFIYWINLYPPTNGLRVDNNILDR